MIARPKMSQNEWKTTEIRASKVGNVSPFSCPGEDASPVLASRRPSSNPPLLSERVVQRKVLNTEVVNDRLATEKKDKDKDEAEMDRLAALATQYEKFNVNRSMGAKPGVDATVIDGGEVSESEWDD